MIVDPKLDVYIQFRLSLRLRAIPSIEKGPFRPQSRPPIPPAGLRTSEESVPCWKPPPPAQQRHNSDRKHRSRSRQRHVLLAVEGIPLLPEKRLGPVGSK